MQERLLPPTIENRETMTQELDKTDLLILRELQDDGHLTIKELAQRVHLSVSPVYERVRRLEREGYIKGYVAILNAEKLDCGFVVFCYLKLAQLTYENAVQFMIRVQNIPEIVEAYNTSGNFDFVLKIYVQNMRQYQDFVMRILGDIPYIGSIESSFVLGEVKSSHRLLIPRGQGPTVGTQGGGCGGLLMLGRFPFFGARGSHASLQLMPSYGRCPAYSGDHRRSPASCGVYPSQVCLRFLLEC